MSSFPSIRIEGGLLAPDLFDQLLAGELPGQKAVDFGLDGKRNLTDEIAAVFGDARALWGVFQNRLARLPEDDIATSVTRDAWMIPFLGLLGYEPRYNQRAHEVDGLTFAISHRASDADGAPPVHIVGARQELGRVPASGRPRLAPHSLVQEYLNRTEHLWGIVTNGVTLRLLRDCTFVRRQAYIEVDLAGILEEQRFNDFAVLYRLLHRSRLPSGMADASACLLERYYSHSVEQGGRVREHLRDGVEECLTGLANGFLRHPANGALRAALVRQDSESVRRGDSETEAFSSSPSLPLSPSSLYRQLLRLVYRFLFLLVSEDRGLISADPIYSEHYGIARLRRLLDQRAAFTDHDDIWQSLRVLWRAFGHETFAATLGVAPLNGELFARQDLDDCSISNRDLLTAFWRLAWYEERRGSPPRRVNYAALDVEELGSVYESLLEYHPAIDADSAGRLEFRLIFGSERKTTGSYYTPPQLVNELVESALEPVLAGRLRGAQTAGERERAILSIRVCDPAAGSGHFLLAAARRLGKELARTRTGQEEPAPERLREAIRDVIRHCIYGVDKNPLAVELCRVALWLESHTGDKPLTFLDHRIRCGDSLLGLLDLGVLKDGIPDQAFEPLEGDDKAFARDVARRNRDERAGQRGLFAWEPEAPLATLGGRSREIDAIADDSPAAIERKKRLYERAQGDPELVKMKDACDLWTAAFFQPLQPDAPAITTAAVVDRLAGRPCDPRVAATGMVIANRERFFHWPLEFPEVFADGGFDVVLSNPPWERVKLQEQEFFAARDARIATAPTKAARAQLIRKLPESDPNLYREYLTALRAASGASGLLRNGSRFPLTGRGDINTYAVFAELCRDAIRAGGRCGIIVPSGIATDDTTKFFFQDLVRSGSLVSLFDFENRRKLFPAVDSRVKFSLLTVCSRGEDAAAEPSRFVFFALGVDDLRRPEKRFTLTPDEIALLNPNTGNCPTFRTQADAELTKAIYRRVPVLWREARQGVAESNPWRLSFHRLFDMSNDSHHFRTANDLDSDGCRREGNLFIGPYGRYLPLYEAKMLHQFDHRWATYTGADEVRDVSEEEKRNPSFVVQPRYWVREEVVDSAIPSYPEPLAVAVRIGDGPSIETVLALWAAGFHLLRGEEASAERVLQAGPLRPAQKEVAKALAEAGMSADRCALARDFPLTEDDAQRIEARQEQPAALAAELVQRFSPRWFLGWRDITNSTNERTLIASALPRCAVGHKFMLLFSQAPALTRLGVVASLNSLCADYVARQKIGGTSMSYFILRQLAVVWPTTYEALARWENHVELRVWLSWRALELLYTAHDLAPLARDCGYDGPPFPWDPERRFEIRCELDAAFFHLYLPATPGGRWRRARTADGHVVDETPSQLSALEAHFPTPRDAVAYILDQFPIVRQKDEAAHGRYRTKERILELYDAMLACQRAGTPFRSSLDPPPGER
ncbi:MAG TPA: N-6 DNA methylase [Thermoanaerobaculaceae bacterium]|nr:N-6 DNA methylase [Thermoanaerobaculaceae bacterium]HRS15321.1 N-6 DNA methylase [Thermoanaerobaculaceae bacterium]